MVDEKVGDLISLHSDFGEANPEVFHGICNQVQTAPIRIGAIEACLPVVATCKQGNDKEFMFDGLCELQ